MCISISKQQLLLDYLFLRDLRSRLFCWKHARPAVTRRLAIRLVLTPNENSLHAYAGL